MPRKCHQEDFCSYICSKSLRFCRVIHTEFQILPRGNLLMFFFRFTNLSFNPFGRSWWRIRKSVGLWFRGHDQIACVVGCIFNCSGCWLPTQQRYKQAVPPMFLSSQFTSGTRKKTLRSTLRTWNFQSSLMTLVKKIAAKVWVLGTFLEEKYELVTENYFVLPKPCIVLTAQQSTDRTIASKINATPKGVRLSEKLQFTAALCNEIWQK